MIQFVFAEVFDSYFKSKELLPELDLVRALPALRHPVAALGYEREKRKCMDSPIPDGQEFCLAYKARRSRFTS